MDLDFLALQAFFTGILGREGEKRYKSPRPPVGIRLDGFAVPVADLYAGLYLRGETGGAPSLLVVPLLLFLPLMLFCGRTPTLMKLS